MTARNMTRLIGAFFACSFLMAPTLGEQLWDQPSANGVGGLSSQDARNPGGLGWFSEVADNFTAAAGWIINEVQFNGGYVKPDPEKGNTEGFTIRFYTDNNNHPGTRVFEQDVFTFTETLYYTSPQGYAGYRYTVLIDPPFSITSADQYWVSVVAILARGGGVTEPQWGWVRSTTTNPPFAHQWFFDPGNFKEKSNDVSLTLIGSSGPTPCPGDFDCDGDRDFDDIDPFVEALSTGQCKCPNFANCDPNGDGKIDFDDIDPFIPLIGVPCP